MQIFKTFAYGFLSLYGMLLTVRGYINKIVIESLAK